MVYMSPTLEKIGIAGYRLLGFENNHGLDVHVEPEAKPTGCLCCGGGRLHSKGPYQRRVRHLSSFGEATWLVIHTRRFRCLDCNGSFIPQLPGVLSGRHSSEPFREEVYRQHHSGICASALANLLKLGQATVERIYHQFTERKANERISLNCPILLGIDEHTLHKHTRFATTFCDLKNQRVFDIVEGRSEKDLSAFVASLQGRERVRVVCIDLSSPYRHLIKKWFPNARIVADRFHVIRIVIHHFMTLCRQIAPNIKNHRGSLAVLRMRPDRLSDAQKKRLLELFKSYPSLRPLYDEMQNLCALLNHKHQTKRASRPLACQLLNTIAQLKASLFQPLITLANTLHAWLEPIACMWRFTKNNGITEGFHRKMKLIQRRAYGFKNFANYRLRVIAQCG
jgi:transposase